MAPNPAAVRELKGAAVGNRHDELVALLARALAASVSGRAFDVMSEVEATLRAAVKFRNHRTFVAERDALVGVVTGRAPGSGPAFIRWVAVDPTLRREGIGTMLVARFTETVQRPNIQGLVNVADPVAMAFWNSRGWRPEEPGARMWGLAHAPTSGPET